MFIYDIKPDIISKIAPQDIAFLPKNAALLTALDNMNFKNVSLPLWPRHSTIQVVL